MNEVLLGNAAVNVGMYNRISTTKLEITEFRKSLPETIVYKSLVNEIQISTGPLQIYTFVKPEAAGQKNVICVRYFSMNCRKL